MKALRSPGMTLAVTALCLGYASCGDDEEDEREPRAQDEESADADEDEINYTGKYDCKVDGIYHTLDFNDRTAKVVGSGRKVLDIPSSIEYEDSTDSSRSGSYSVTSIGYNAFYYCSSLTSITSLNPTPPSCSSSAFSGVDMSACTLLVPAGSKDAYASATGWSVFHYII
ncbi:MAG: leucine-rich repeat domain-containing protein [Prevotellaceae bacterium]|nr:leucine-rich repeat domain-containing protein [Prevotellaceae bacterium]